MQNTWQSSDDLTNFFINKKSTNNSLISSAYNKKTDICCFSHVPKTAGTSLESVIAKNFQPSEVLHINAPDLNRLPALVDAKKSRPKLICGHHPMHGLLYQLIADSRLFHFTQLRNPVDRVLSYFNYVKGKHDHPMHPHTDPHSLEGFLLANPSPELSNGQSRRFSGYLHTEPASNANMINEAKDVLENCFSMVLTTCLFDEGLLLLKKRLRLSDIYYLRKNKSTPFVHKSELSDSTLNLIMENNQADTEIFNWVKTRCENLIQQELSKQLITQFKSNNQQWRDLINR